jgi:hypothetical protein
VKSVRSSEADAGCRSRTFFDFLRLRATILRWSFCSQASQDRGFDCCVEQMAPRTFLMPARRLYQGSENCRTTSLSKRDMEVGLPHLLRPHLFLVGSKHRFRLAIGGIENFDV